MGNPTPLASPTGGNTPTQTIEQGDPALTVTGFVFSDGQFDPHKTQVGTLHGQQAFSFSRLMSFLSQAQGTIATDLALDLPEQPDSQTYIFRLNEAALWHDVDPLFGRPVVANDVKYSIDRQLQGDQSFARRDRWTEIIESVEAPSPSEVVIKARTPFAPMLARLADANAFIVPPEHDEAGNEFGPNRQMGSGPFEWVEWDESNFASFRRNDEWYGPKPQLSGVSIMNPRNTAEVEAALRVRDLDVAFVGARQAERLKGVVPDLREQFVGNAQFFGMRFNVTRPPFDDPRFRSALAYSMDRLNMVDVFFQGSGDANPWVSWPVANWALPRAELTGQPGYRLGSGARAQDIADARALVAAMEADGKTIPTTLPLAIEVTTEQQLSLGSIMARHINEALGIEVQLEQLEISELVRRHFYEDAAWIAGPDTGWLDLDDWTYQYFHSGGTQNSFALRDADMDALLEAQRAEFNADARREIGYNIQRRLLATNPGVNFVSERVVALSWPYVRDFPMDIADGYQNRFASCWIDTNDPTFRR